MAQYRGTISGQRGQASRLGSKASGLVSYTASWQGAVSVSLWYDSRTDTDMADVSLTTHTNGAGTERVLYSGPVSGAPYLVDNQSKTGAKCGCKRGVARDNCPTCEGTGYVIDFAAIRARTQGAK